MSCAGTEQQLAEAQQRSADQAQELTAAQTDLDQLSHTHERLQQQLQVKVIKLQQTEDSLEERSRQHRQLQTQADDQSAQILQLRDALQSSTQAGAELESQLADKTSTVSGRATATELCALVQNSIEVFSTQMTCSSGAAGGPFGD